MEALSTGFWFGIGIVVFLLIPVFLGVLKKED